MKSLWPLLCLFCLPLWSASPDAQPPRKIVVAYVPNWLDLAAFAPKIDFAKVTHLNLAFENPTNDVGDLAFKASDQVILDLGKEHQVKVLMSIGGGSAADDPIIKPRYQALMSADKRKDFAASLAEYVNQHGFDGLDVDLEGPTINDDYGPFIDELAAALKAKGKLLTAALSRGYGGDRVPDATLLRYDFVNIMAYDAAGPWNPDQPGQHSSLAFAGQCLDYWLNRGLPKEKTVLGVPFYGYGFGDTLEKKSYTYRELVETFPGAEQTDQVGETIWYNGIPTMKAKARLILDRHLAGAMIWSLNGDADGDASLLSALDAVFKTEKSSKAR